MLLQLPDPGRIVVLEPPLMSGYTLFKETVLKRWLSNLLYRFLSLGVNHLANLLSYSEIFSWPLFFSSHDWGREMASLPLKNIGSYEWMPLKALALLCSLMHTLVRALCWAEMVPVWVNWLELTRGCLDEKQWEQISTSLISIFLS